MVRKSVYLVPEINGIRKWITMDEKCMYIMASPFIYDPYGLHVPTKWELEEEIKERESEWNVINIEFLKLALEMTINAEEW